MAGRGPAPKDRAELRRRNILEPMTVVSVDGKVYGPELPDTHDWPKATLAWWEIWRKCAQASTFTETDWAFLLDTAVLHADFWLGNRSVAAELRLRAAKFGATPEDRARLKLQVGNPPAVASPGRLEPKSSQERRERLLKAVGDGRSET